MEWNRCNVQGDFISVTKQYDGPFNVIISCLTAAVIFISYNWFDFLYICDRVLNAFSTFWIQSLQSHEAKLETESDNAN